MLPHRPGEPDQHRPPRGAGKVWLDLHASADQLTLRIADDGRGGVAIEGAGINGMRERALLVNATLTITSPPGEGTEVRLAVPSGAVMPARIPARRRPCAGTQRPADDPRCRTDLKVVAEAADGYEAVAALDHTRPTSPSSISRCRG